MYFYLLTFHSLIRWIVLFFLVYAVIRASVGVWKANPFSSTDNFFRHSTATAAHIQMMIGVILFTKSPAVRAFWSSSGTSVKTNEFWFFGLFHVGMMVTSIVLLTIGSAMLKRKITDKDKFQTMLIWFGMALVIMLLAIPWPFLPWSQRPYLRWF